MVAVAIAAHVLRTHARAMAGWTLLFGAVVFSSAYGYVKAYPSLSDRLGLQTTLGRNVGLAALFGRPVTLSSLGGFTAWRAGGVLLIAGVVWGIFLGARILRGEEDDGRWELIRAGAADARRATAAALAGAAVLLMVIWWAAALAVFAARSYAPNEINLAGAFLLGATVVGPAALGLCLAACCGQLTASRRQAAVLSGSIVAAAYLGRMLVAVYPHLRWLRWFDPLCWYDETAPLTRNDGGWLLAAYLLCAALAAAAIAFSGRRDLGAALMEPSARLRAPTRRVRGTLGLTASASGSAAAAWVIVLTVLAFVVGVLSGPVGKAAVGSAGMQQILDRITGGAQFEAKSFLGLTMVTMTTVLALCAAALVGATRDEEATGRLTTLLSRPLSRTRWLAGRVAVGAGLLLGGGLAIGIGMIVGTSVGSGGVAIRTLLAAGLNAVPVAAVAFGLGIAMYGVHPRLAAPAAYAVVAGSFAIEMVGSLVRAPAWVLDLSVLHHLALAPAVPIRGSADIALVAVAVVLGAIGVAAFRRRDLVEL